MNSTSRFLAFSTALFAFVTLCGATFAVDHSGTATHSRPWLIAAQFGGAYASRTHASPGWQASGFGYDFDVIVPLSRRFALLGSVSESGLHVPENYSYWEPEYTTLSSSVEYSATSYTLSLRYTQSVHWPFRLPRLQYYFYAGGGGISQDLHGRMILKRAGYS